MMRKVGVSLSMPAKGSRVAGPADVAVGVRLRLRRRLLGLSQSELAGRIGVSFQQVQKYERGANRIAASTLVAAAQALQCSPSWLLGLETEPDGTLALPPLLARDGALQLLRDYARIADPEARRLVRATAQALAEGRVLTEPVSCRGVAAKGRP